MLPGYFLLAQQKGPTVVGAVVDSVTGSPLAGVSVFLNNTSRGTATASNGHFRLEDLPKGNYQLIFSAIGYATRVIDINGNHQPPDLYIRLHAQATELAAVTVAPYDRHGWGKWGKFFTDNFIGAGDNAPFCKLKNRSALRFYFSHRTGRLIVTATEPLHIGNDALGYELTYQLESFSADTGTKLVRFYGYPWFLPMTPRNEDQQKFWDFKRRQAYRGSVMHFMRSLYSGRTISEGFLVEKEVTGINEEKQRVKNIYRPDFQRAGEFPIDTLHYFWDVLRQPDIITKTPVVPPDSILTVDADSTRELYFASPIIVLYGVNERARGDYESSGLGLATPQKVKIEENGSYYPPQEIVGAGHWALSEKISNLLPLDYPEPPPSARP